MQKTFYLCPLISKVAIVGAVIKPAETLKKYLNGKFELVILNVAGK